MADTKEQPIKRAYKKRQPAKRKYVKRSPKWVLSKKDGKVYPELRVNLESIVKRDELDLLRDMLAIFESLNEEARHRAYKFFVDKYEGYDSKHL